MAHKLIALWLLAVTLSIDPTTYTVTFSPDPDNAEVHIWIEGNPQVNPYSQSLALQVEANDSVLIVPRHPLPKGSYTIWAGIYRWVKCELVLFDGTTPMVIHVP